MYRLEPFQSRGNTSKHTHLPRERLAIEVTAVQLSVVTEVARSNTTWLNQAEKVDNL